MQKLKTLGLWALIFIVLGSIGLALYNPTYDVTITETETQKFIETQTPLTIKQDDNVYIIQEAQVEFMPSGKLYITGHIDMDFKGRTSSVNVETSGKLAYRNGNFYVQDLFVHEIDMKDLKLTKADELKISALKEFKKGLMNKFLGGEKNNPAISALLKEWETNLKETAKILTVTLLAKVPVYSLSGKDIEYDLAKLALAEDGIKITDKKTLTVTLSIGLLIGKLWLFVLAFFASIGLAFALMRNPAGLAALFAFSAIS
jgi:hypothetical protein